MVVNYKDPRIVKLGEVIVLAFSSHNLELINLHQNAAHYVMLGFSDEDIRTAITLRIKHSVPESLDTKIMVEIIETCISATITCRDEYVASRA